MLPSVSCSLVWSSEFCFIAHLSRLLTHKALERDKVRQLFTFPRSADILFVQGGFLHVHHLAPVVVSLMMTRNPLEPCEQFRGVRLIVKLFIASGASCSGRFVQGFYCFRSSPPLQGMRAYDHGATPVQKLCFLF